jgi:hypothetical protein
MLLSKKSAFSAIALSLLVLAPITAKTPATFLEKIGVSILQTIHRHPFVTSIALSSVNSHALQLPVPKNWGEAVVEIGILSVMNKIEWTFIDALTKNFEVDPIQ